MSETVYYNPKSKLCQLCEDVDVYNVEFEGFEGSYARIDMDDELCLGDSGHTYRMVCNYCPLCGRKLEGE